MRSKVVVFLLAAPLAMLSAWSTAASNGERTVDTADALQSAVGAQYTVEILAAPVGLSDTNAFGVRAGRAVGTGRIAGSSLPTNTHAVLWPASGAAPIDLHPVGWRFSAAFGTDGRRHVGSGSGPPTGFARHALLWRGTTNAPVDLHPGEPWNDSVARSIAAGMQVGNINDYDNGNESSPFSREHASLWRGTATSVVDLHPSVRGITRSYASDTDGTRQVGYGFFGTSPYRPYRALLWAGTAVSVVVLHPPGFTHSFAEGVFGNQQVGYAFNTLRGDGSTRALLWRGSAESVVNLNPRGFLGTAAYDTNGRQQVGSGVTPDNASQSHALRWSGTRASVVDLHALLPAAFRDGGSIAYDIDGAGNIVGLAQRPDGSTVAVRWRRAS